MKFRYLLIIFQLFLFSESCVCQKAEKGRDETPVSIDDDKANPTNLALARFEINDIKTRGIIVRLKTNKERIAAYKKVGNTKVANGMEEKAKVTNLILMYAFVTEWTYCPIYFMESQNTAKLMQSDTLIAKAFDLKHDTTIYMNHDSFYIVDYGALMENEVADNSKFKDFNKTEESNNPISDECLVVKNHDQKQLQSPMPLFTKVLFPELTSTDNIEPIILPNNMNDSINLYLSQYKSITDLLKSPVKLFVSRYMDSIYTHIIYVNNNIGGTNKVNKKLSFGELDSNGPRKGGGGAGNPFQRAVKRLNKSFISYYCKRLDKDRNILCRDDIEYWWQRNPNIRYFPYLQNLETELKGSLDSGAKFTK
jgi:hypothetical protein